MTSHIHTLYSVFLFFILSTSSENTLSSFQKLKEISLSLCPKQENSTIPHCQVLTQKLVQMKTALIQNSISDIEEPSEEIPEEQGDLRKPLIEQTLAIIQAFEDQSSPSNCEPGEIAKLLFQELKKVSGEGSTQSWDHHYLTLFVFCAIILGLLLASQIYHCVTGHVKDRRVKKAKQEASRAQNLYSNLQQIHRYANQAPLMGQH